MVNSILVSQNISLELVADGFNEPLDIQNAGDDRLFVVEKGGKIKILHSDGSVLAAPFLDISSKVSTRSEQGLLGLAFHPNFTSNGFFYVNYTNLSGDTHISRFSVTGFNPNLADLDSELLLLSYHQPQVNHNGGTMLFGPDGYLYISSGDGGESGDSNNNAQNINSYLGKILRINVDQVSGATNYSIPEDNPFFNNPDAKHEIWAYGLRNPWRFTIDEVDGNIWIADVGQAEVEEINKQPMGAAGLNYGWRCYEGTHPFNTTNCPASADLTFPLIQYLHSITGGCSITGGRVYRGNSFSDMNGCYFFADYCKGFIGTVNTDGTMYILGEHTANWVAFGEDLHKELYLADISRGGIHKITNASLSVDEIQQTGFRIFPNPATTEIWIESNGDIRSFILYDIRGAVIKTWATPLNSSKIYLDLSDIGAGIYFINGISNQNTSVIRKIIVRK